MSQTDTTIEPLIAALVARIEPRAELISARILSGGTSQDSWLIETRLGKRPHDFVLRRAPGGDGEKRDDAIGLDAEAEVIRAAGKNGVPVPGIVTRLRPEDGLGTGFVMNRVLGETVARKIFRAEDLAAIRPRLAHLCGEALARISQVPLDAIPSLETWDAARRLADARALHARQGLTRPAIDYTLNWLEERLPADQPRPRLVHGDFRNGNLMINADGVGAVLDWEIAHFGSPIEDLGWFCVPSWRFGRLDDVAGGFGPVEDLLAGYEAGGGPPVDRIELHFWTVLGTLMWGQVCIRTAFEFRNERFAIEPAVIGRRLSEVELDLMMLTGARDGELL
ncbi:phosphotransferase family protein [Novosphingopyxis sp.]|uniref:phosphotransferase family protein n=1 Tax=Novosphingopyxis sp. TaxID=2709690 RepID=UPI003B5C52EA